MCVRDSSGFRHDEAWLGCILLDVAEMRRPYAMSEARPGAGLFIPPPVRPYRMVVGGACLLPTFNAYVNDATLLTPATD